MQASATFSSQSRTNRELGGPPRYNEIHVDHEISVTSSRPKSNISQGRPKYSLTPIIHSPSGSSQSEYSQSNHGQESPATSIERSSDPISEGTIANLDTMLVSRNTSSATRSHSAKADVMTDRMAHRELVDFLRTCEPPSNHFMSVPENLEETVKRKGSFKLFARRSNRRKRLLRLPDSAVAATTTHGYRHIAISIRDEYDHPELKSQYQYHASVKTSEPQTRSPQKLQKSPPRIAGSATVNSPNISINPKTGTVTVKKPTVKPSISHPQNRNGSACVNTEQGPWSFEAPTAAQSNSLAARSRSDINAPGVIGADNAVLLQKFWEQHPPPENRHELSGLPLKVSQAVQLSPGKQGSEMTDPRHSGGTAYSERTLGTAGGHSRESSGNSSKIPSGARLVMIGNHPARTSSRSKASNAIPATPRSFALRHPSSKSTAVEASTSQKSPLRITVPAKTHNGDNDLISLSGFLGSPSSKKPPQPGPAPNRKLPDLPEGCDVSRNVSSSSNNKIDLRGGSTLPQIAQSSSKPSSKPVYEDFEKASSRKDADYSNHPANRTVDRAVREVASTMGPVQNARQLRQDRVRAKKQRDVAHSMNDVKSQSRTVRPEERSQHQTASNIPTLLSRNSTVKGSVRAARKRTESLLPAPLDFGPFSNDTSNKDRPQTSRSLPATFNDNGNEDRAGLPASSFESGNGKGSVRDARKRSESLMSSLAKVEASPTISSKLENPSLRAAANALSSIMVVAEGKPHQIKSNSCLPPSNPNQVRSPRVNEFPLPPRSAKRQSPQTIMTRNLPQGGFLNPGAQTPPRSPSPSLQSSDEEGSSNDGRNITGTSTKVPLRSYSQGKSTSIKPTIIASKAKTIAIYPSRPPQQRVTTITPSHSRNGSRNSKSIINNTHPPISHPPPKQSPNSIRESTTASLTAAINAFELHRSNRRKERNRLIRDRRARELAIQKERTVRDEAIDKRLTKGVEKQGELEERLNRIEDRSIDMAKKYDLIIAIAKDLEVIKHQVKKLEDKAVVNSINITTQTQSQKRSSTARESNLMSPVVGKVGSRGMRIDISMPSSTIGEPQADQNLTPPPRPRNPSPKPPPTSQRNKNHPISLPTQDDLEVSAEEEACPQYSGHGTSDLLGGGGGGVNFAFAGPGRPGTPIGSLIEELEMSSSKSSSVRGVLGRDSDTDRERTSVRRVSLPRVRRGKAVYGSKGNAGNGGSGSGGVEVEKRVVISDLDS